MVELGVESRVMFTLLDPAGTLIITLMFHTNPHPPSYSCSPIPVLKFSNPRHRLSVSVVAKLTFQPVQAYDELPSDDEGRVTNPT